MQLNLQNFNWTRKPAQTTVHDDCVIIQTEPHTDLWQRTYYHFQNDNAPLFQMETAEKYFSFIVKTQFNSHHRFDQCGVVMYLDSENWLKASVEYENDDYQHLGSVVTNHGYSDWATTTIAASIQTIWYRFSRREADFRLEFSLDGVNYAQMRICHLWAAQDTIQFGIYACSPEASSFEATFTNFALTECQWAAHDGQAPDKPIDFHF